jgi:hypothetical protein
MMNHHVRNMLNAIEQRRDSLMIRIEHLKTHLDNLPQDQSAAFLRTIWMQEKMLLEDELRNQIFLRELLWHINNDISPAEAVNPVPASPTSATAIKPAVTEKIRELLDARVQRMRERKLGLRNWPAVDGINTPFGQALSSLYKAEKENMEEEGRFIEELYKMTANEV